jgi:alpha-tubulin suppressor-like RCC1 family protein
LISTVHLLELRFKMSLPSNAIGRFVCTVVAGLFATFSHIADAQLSHLPAGRVVAWGDNTFGQTNVTAATDVVAISANGDCCNLALRANGNIVPWGATLAVPPGVEPAIGIAAGSLHHLAVRANGTVAAWGVDNTFGQLTVPPNVTNATAVAVGEFHSLALQAARVIGWGANNVNQREPAAGVNNNISAIASGLNHSIALRSNGTVIAWGNNANGALRITVPPGAINVSAIAAGADHSLALRSNGMVVAWGINTSGQSTVPAGLSGVRAIGAGGDHSIAVLSNGTVVTWGRYRGVDITNRAPAGTTNLIAVSGGFNHSVGLSHDRVRIATHPVSQTVLEGATVTFTVVAAGGQPITYQWRENGTPITFATNSTFQLFNVTTNDIANYSVLVRNALGEVTSTNATLLVNVPVSITGQPQSQEVGVGDNINFHVTARGTAPLGYQWRRNGVNVFGAQSSTLIIPNVQITNAGNYTVVVTNSFSSVTSQVAVLIVQSPPTIIQHPQSRTVPAGSSATFSVVAENATGYQWLKNGGAIPNATNTFYAIPNAQPSDAAGYSVIVSNSFASVTSQTAALTVTVPPPSSTTVLGWGVTEVFNGTVWVDVRPPNTLGNVTNVAVGGAHSLALRADGSVVGWGDNSFGQIGIPPGVTSIVAIAAGQHHSVALRRDGQVFAWGRSDNFQQTTVPPHSNVIAIAAGASHSLAVQSNGVVFGWGRNDDGRSTPPPTLGQARNVGAGQDHSLAVRTDLTVRGWGGQNVHGETTPPPGLANVIAVAAGANHSMAIQNNGAVVVWGNNSFGQRNVPSFASPAKAIASGANHCVALLENGTVVAWGNNANGQTNFPTVGGITAIAAGGDRSLAVKLRQLEMQTPVRLGNGRTQLTVSNDDGSAVTPEQLNRVQVLTSSNLVSTSTSWAELTNAKSIVSGSIRVEDTVTNLPRRFYRARENP